MYFQVIFAVSHLCWSLYSGQCKTDIYQMATDLYGILSPPRRVRPALVQRVDGFTGTTDNRIILQYPRPKRSWR